MRLPSLRKVVIAAAVVAVLAPSAAWATDHTDPAADTCKGYPGPGGPTSVQFCGADIATASDRLDPNGTAHVVVTTDAANCVGNGLNQHSNPRFGIFAPAATSATSGQEIGEIASDFGTNNFFYQVGASKIALSSVVQGTTTLTYDISLPKSLTETFGSTLKWMVGNSCIGEGPWEASDIAPDTGLYALTLGAPAPDTTPPSAPLSVGVTKRGTTYITIAWSASTDNIGVTGYKVFLGSGLVGNTTERRGSVTVACGGSYAISVAARDAAGNVSTKTTVHASTLSCVVGTPSNDNLPGTPKNDVMHGKGGNDTMSGGAGNDTIYGEAGNDVLRGGPGNDRITGGPGKDKINGGPGTDTCYFNAGDTVSQCEHKVKR